jgi:hypothetical protein
MTSSGGDMTKLLQKFKDAKTGEKEKKIEDEDVKLSFMKSNYEFFMELPGTQAYSVDQSG